MRNGSSPTGRPGLYVDLLAPILVGLVILVVLALLLLYGGHGATS